MRSFLLFCACCVLLLSYSCKKHHSQKTTGIDGLRNWHHSSKTYTTIIDSVTHNVSSRTADSAILPDDQSILDTKRQDLLYAHGFAKTDSFLSCSFYSTANTLSLVDYYPSKDSIVLTDQTTQTSIVSPGDTKVKIVDVSLLSYTY